MRTRNAVTRVVAAAQGLALVPSSGCDTGFKGVYIGAERAAAESAKARGKGPQPLTADEAWAAAAAEGLELVLSSSNETYEHPLRVEAWPAPARSSSTKRERNSDGNCSGLHTFFSDRQKASHSRVQRVASGYRCGGRSGASGVWRTRFVAGTRRESRRVARCARSEEEASPLAPAACTLSPPRSYP